LHELCCTLECEHQAVKRSPSHRHRCYLVCTSSDIPTKWNGRPTERRMVSSLLIHLPHNETDPHHRYINMDLLFWSHVMCVYWSFWMLWIQLSYDIACQFGLGLMKQFMFLPSWIQHTVPPAVSFCVPKFHLLVHVKKCWGAYSFNFRKYVGRTDGEGPERLWSLLNPVANSVSMMTQGARYDTLDDFCNHNNWLKTVKLGRFQYRSF
jgi:hypothetical protein